MKKANVALFVPNLGCPHACSFCDQREIAGKNTIPTPLEVDKTARTALAQLGEKAANAEIAFFGGSFTAIEPTLMCSLLSAAAPYVGRGGFKGIRISTRPDSIDANILTILKRFLVSSIELGAQSMSDDVLTLNRRGHTSHDVETASALIRAYGFELGLQMMTGLYGSSPEKDKATARAIASLCPTTVRIYPTVVIEGTQLAKLYRDGVYKPPELADSVKLCAELLEYFHKKSIQVIRLGLHATPSIEESYVAGPWHPAFRELCESVIYRKEAEEALNHLFGGCREALGNRRREAVLFVAPQEISKIAGQHRENILALEDEFHIRMKIRGREMAEYEVEAEWSE